MITKRVIPCLLLKGNGLYKTRRFKDPTYIGDPVNAVRIFNEKEADELVILDIDASKHNQTLNYRLIDEVAGEAFMPIAYGGGIQSIDQVQRIIGLGIEKVVINSALFSSSDLISEIVDLFGSQAVVGAIDYKTTFLGKRVVYSHAGRKKQSLNPLAHAKHLTQLGVGEVFLNSIDRDGEMTGFDLELIKLIAKEIDVPLICCGGAGSYADIQTALDHGASAVSAGSLFVFKGKHRAVLINYDPRSLL